MPRTDPRYVNADLGEILHDLLVLRYRRHMDRLSSDKTYAAEHAAGDDRVTEEMAARADAVRSDQEFLDMVKRGIEKHRRRSGHDDLSLTEIRGARR